MQKIMAQITAWIARVEQRRLTAGTFFSVFTALVVVRVVEQQIIEYQFTIHSWPNLLYGFVHFYLTFILLFAVLAFAIRYILRIPWRHIINILLAGFFIIILPPIVDVVRFGHDFWSYYEFAGLRDLLTGFATIFAASPDRGATDGMRAEIILATVGIALYASTKIQPLWRKIAAVSSVYIILGFFASVPSWIAIAVYGFDKGFWQVTDVDVAQIFLAPHAILTHRITDVISVLHIHMSMLYFAVLIIVGSVALYARRHQTFIRYGAVFYTGIISVLVMLLGSSTVLLFTEETVAILFTSLFAFVAYGILVSAVAIMIPTLQVFVQDATRRVVASIIVAFLIAGTAIVNTYVVFLLCGIIALFALRELYFVRSLCSKIFLDVLSYLLFFFVGAVAVSHNVNALLSVPVLLWVVLVILSMMAMRELYCMQNGWDVAFLQSPRMARYVVAILWCGTILGALAVYNVYDLTFFALSVVAAMWMMITASRNISFSFVIIVATLYTLILSIVLA
jgi:hypothetical protein